MFRLLLGTAGTGKTTRLVEKIEHAVKDGSRAVLLVPEQYSFEAERLLYRKLGPRLALEVEVLSFTRMCNFIFRRCGGLAGVTVGEAGKYMLMSVALGEVADQLVVYRKSAANTAFLATMVSACGELKTAGITPRRLEELRDKCAPSPLRDKLEELSAIYGAYQGLLSRGYIDPDDDLIRAERLLAEQDCFSGCQVFVDGFTTFMAAEFALLGQVIAQARETTFALTADGLHDEGEGTGVFSPVKSAAARLIRYAKSSGVPVATPEILDQPQRYRAAPLAHLSRELFQPRQSPCPQEAGEAVQLLEAGDIWREIELVAAKIAAMVRREGYRYNEIALVARDPEPYGRAIEALFARYGIPFFADAREEVENLPLVSGVLYALEAVRSNFDSEAVLAFAKSPITGLDPEQVAHLENYCYCWGVRGAGWTAPFANNPRGLAETLTEGDLLLLEQINGVRQAVAAPLSALSASLHKTDGRRFAKGVFDLLQTVGAAEHLTAYAQQLDGGARESFLDGSAQLWDALMEILDVFGAVLGGVGLSAARACELFRLAVNTAEVAQLPQTLDQVLVGGADRIRPGQVRAVFVIGANEGVFPRQAAGGGLFTDAERQEMIGLGAELSPPSLQQAVLEKFFAYYALTLPSLRLHVSWPRRDGVGRELQPSVIVAELGRLFPGIWPDRPDDLTLLEGERSALELLARNLRRDDAFVAALLQYFSQHEKSAAVARMERYATSALHGLSDRRAARRLFGENLRLSPSRVERFYRCPFSYFAADGLSLKKRKRVEFTPLESGSVIHNVLQVMVQRHGGKGLAALTREQLQEEIRQVIQDYLSHRVEDPASLPARFRYLFTRLAGMLARLLEHMGREFLQSEFEPYAFELPIQRGGAVEPLELQTADGARVVVEGIVDRVDVMEKRGKRYVRVVDYKSGTKDFALHDLLYGLNMQMLLYLFTIAEQGRGPLENAIPAGVLYMPVREKYISTERDTEAEALDREREKQLKMNGLLLRDEEVLRGMERDLEGVFIPAKLGKNGQLDGKSALADLAEMGRLAGKVREMILNMAQSLGQGEIPSMPVAGGDYDACAYCDYRQVCGFEQGDPVRTIAKIDRQACLELLKEEEAHV